MEEFENIFSQYNKEKNNKLRSFDEKVDYIVRSQLGEITSDEDKERIEEMNSIETQMKILKHELIKYKNFKTTKTEINSFNYKKRKEIKNRINNLELRKREIQMEKH